MPRPNFFNDNINRTFPFQWKTAGVATPASGPVTMLQLPDEFVADCGFVMGPESGYVEGVDYVYLYKISRVSSEQFNYEFRTTAPKMAAFPIIFYRLLSDPIYKTDFVESDIPDPGPSSQSLSLSRSIPLTVCGEPFWSGYLVTGPIEKVADRLEVGQSITRTAEDQAIVEPALIQNLDQNQIVSLNIANADRTRAVRPGGCTPNRWPFPTGTNTIYIDEECLQGHIRFRPGYNLAISQNSQTNTLQLSAIVNAGMGEPCEQVKLFPYETPPSGAPNNLLAGDFYCNEVLRTVNGVQGPNLSIFAGTGVSVLANDANNTITVDINLADLSLCAYSAVSISV